MNSTALGLSKVQYCCSCSTERARLPAKLSRSTTTQRPLRVAFQRSNRKELFTGRRESSPVVTVQAKRDESGNVTDEEKKTALGSEALLYLGYLGFGVIIFILSPIILTPLLQVLGVDRTIGLPK